MTRLTVDVPADLFVALKVKCAQERRKMHDVVAQMLAMYLVHEKGGEQ